MLLLSQQTVVEEHSLPVPTPTTVTGEQSRPTNASMGPRTMPSRPRMIDTTGSVDCKTNGRGSHSQT